MAGIGVFICWCGHNIASNVDVKKIAEEINLLPNVSHASEYHYMCSEPGQKTIIEAIKEKDLDRVVVAACSPRLHELTFRNTCASAGLNPYKCEIANIREQCSWVHNDREKATNKAKETILGIVEKTAMNESLNPIEVPVTKRALIVGGGISGIYSALNIAENGHEVVLVEKNSVLGGHMVGLAETYLTHDCSPCLLSAKIMEVKNHPKIRVLTNSEVETLDGYIGNFKAGIKIKPTYIDTEKCNSCGICLEKCPVTKETSNGTTEQYQAIHIPYTQDLPAPAVINTELCEHFSKGCSICEEVCPHKAVDFKQKDKNEEVNIGAVVIATGYDLFQKDKLPEYGRGMIADVIDGLQFEKLLSIWDKEHREIRRPSDGKVPKEIVFVQCAGSRDPDKGVAYCSRICCMITAKQARLYKQAVPDGQAYVFYIDNRTGGKGYEEYTQEIISDERIMYLRGKVSKIFQENGHVTVWGVDTLTDHQIEINADLVVLATAITPSSGVEELAKRLKVAVDQNGFFAEVHPKLKPVESPTLGIFLAGCAQAPRDIPESITHALGAASKVNAMFSSDKLLQEPIIVEVDEDLCVGCGICVDACPYSARVINEWKKTAKVIEAVCQGCGACCAACPNKATQQKNLTNRQLFKLIDAVL